MKIFSNRTGGFIPALILAVMLMIGGAAQKSYAQYGDDQYGNYGDMSYQNFYDELSPYGQWMNDPQYGYVWAPNAGRDFRPYYTNGYWMMTDYGNMWMSNYSWGWAPFHYGRWTLSSYYGWIWIPGNEWGPAWVSWRQGGGNYGWAPMGPGININISFGSGYNVPNPWWTFIPCGNIYSRNFHRYYSPRQTVNIINNTTIINNTYVDARARTTYVTGPRRSDVETATRQKVTVYNVSNRSRMGNANVSGRNVSVYRPSVRQSSDRGQQTAAPRQFKALDRSVVNNPGARQSGATNSNDRLQENRSAQPRNQGSRSVQPQSGNSRQLQQSNDARQRNEEQLQRNQQLQQQRDQQQRSQQLQEQQRNQQIQQQRNQQQEQQRNLRMQQQQDQQRNQQMQQQQEQQRNLRMQQQQEQQRNQQIQQQRNQQQEQQRNQRMQQQQDQQRNQQIQQQRSSQMQQQRSMQQAQPQRVERSAPVQRSAPATERSARGR